MKLIAYYKNFSCIAFGFFCMAGYSQNATDSLLLTVNASFVTDYTPEENKYKPVKPFSFITHVPGNIGRFVKTPFQKKSLVPLAIIAGSTTVLLFLDEPIIKGAENTFRHLEIEQQENFHSLVRMGKKDMIRFPGNVNTFFYILGRPVPTFLLAGGFYLHGKIYHNSRSARTASEIIESFLTSSITVQTLKRITGRQSPNKATVPGGKWHWFPSLSDYEKNVTNYIAYPSGHMATMMSVVTVIAENYPEKKWIKPVGYTLTGLTALSMLNNKVHWASDFPLGIGIGYLSAKLVHWHNHRKERVRKVMIL